MSYGVALAMGPPKMTSQVLDFSAKLIGPLGAAFIAWAGVSHTVLNSRRQEISREWHQDLRWATELCASENPFEVTVGIALLDELDDYSFLEPDQVRIVGTISETVANAFYHDFEAGVEGADGDDG